jgi:hypothetical protein
MGSLFKPKIPPPPPERPPVAMPDPGAPEVRDAGRAAMAARRRGSGRSSTLLSGNEGSSGAAYSRTMLGT